LKITISVPPTKQYISHVSAEINVGGNNFCNVDFTEDWHIVVNLNLLCGFINKTLIANIAVVLLLFLKIHQTGDML